MTKLNLEEYNKKLNLFVKLIYTIDGQRAAKFDDKGRLVRVAYK